MGVALTACTPPAKGSPLFELGDDEIEMGVGIHGEPGRERAQARRAPTRSSTSCSTRSSPTCRTSPGDSVALMVNGLGGTPISELYILYRRAHQQLAERGHHRRAAATSASTARRSTWPAASLTLVKLDDEIDGLLDAPAEVAVRVF